MYLNLPPVFLFVLLTNVIIVKFYHQLSTE